MRDFVLGMLSLAIIAVGVILYSQQTTIEAQGQALHELNASLAATSQATALDLQAKCAKQAEEFYKTNGWQSNKFAWYADHYNAALNKCFVFIVDAEPVDNPLGHTGQDISELV